MLAPALACAAEFVPPSEAARAAAAGALDQLAPPLRRAFTDCGEFQPKKPPANSDWLASHEEPGQNYAQYLAARPNLPGGGRTKIHILPLGTFAPGKSPGVHLLQQHAAAYFHPLPVEVLPAVADREVPATSRTNGFTNNKPT